MAPDDFLRVGLGAFCQFIEQPEQVGNTFHVVGQQSDIQQRHVTLPPLGRRLFGGLPVGRLLRRFELQQQVTSKPRLFGRVDIAPRPRASRIRGTGYRSVHVATFTFPRFVGLRLLSASIAANLRGILFNSVFVVC